MKVLMFGWEFPPYISGGLGTACHGLTTAMSELGCEILFVLPKTTGKVDFDGPLDVKGADGYPIMARKESSRNESTTLVNEYIEKEETFKTIEFNSLLMPYQTETEYEKYFEKVEAERKLINKSESTDVVTSVETTQVGEFEFKGGYGPQLMSEVYRFGQFGAEVAVNETYDVIHAHDWMTYPAGIAAKHATGKPLIIHVHATEFDRSGQSVNQRVYDLERHGMHEADRICAVSNRTKQIITDHYGIHPDKVEVVHNAVVKNEEVLPTYERGLEEKTVLFLGRITMQKGPDFFVDAAHLVYKKLKNVHFVMAGSGDLYPRMIHRVSAMGMQDRFHFTGFLRGEDLDRVFSITDLCIMPSVSEPFGIVPIEAMRFGLPVIVSKQSGVSEILDHAIKVNFWDTELLAEKIIEVLTDEDKTNDMIEKNNENLGRIDWKDAAGTVIKVYEGFDS